MSIAKGFFPAGNQVQDFRKSQEYRVLATNWLVIWLSCADHLVWPKYNGIKGYKKQNPFLQASFCVPGWLSGCMLQSV
jgi:hypothetical protein